MRKILLAAVFLMAAFSAQCSHLVGGELSYTCSGNNQYHITLKLYRDCNCTGCAPYGNPEYVSIFDASGNLVSQLAMPFPGADTLASTVSSPCLIPPSVCVEQAIYTGDTTLPFSPGGYTIVYQRCCRNVGLVNLVASQQGATFTIEIPDSSLAVCNSSPHFNSLPPLFICANAPVTIDYSATDPNGDSLVYSLCDPYGGASVACPDPSPASLGGGCPLAPPSPPYAAAVYAAPYSAANFTNNPSTTGDFTIDPRTGILTGTPNTIGLFDVTVCVSEYRNGHLLGVLRRDFEFTVAQCNTPIAAIPRIGTVGGTGLYIVDCQSLTVNFINNSYNPPPLSQPISYSWNFGVPGSTTDTSTQVNPTFTFPDTGIYRVELIAVKAEGGGVFCSDTTFSLVYVYPTFTTDFSVSNMCQDSVAQFTDLTQSAYGHINAYNWNFGDGTTSNQSNPGHTYAAPGTYTVTLINGNALGCADTAQHQVTIYPVPNAYFTHDTSCTGSAINFRDTAGGAANYIWNFGDGTGSNVQNPSHIFAPGTYTVSLIAESAQGCKDTMKRVLVIAPLDSTHFTFTRACANTPITFTDSASGIASYRWNFGDGSAIDSLSNPSHTYTAAATYTVTLVVVSIQGCKDSVSETVSVLPSPVVTVSNDTTICKYGSAQLQATGGPGYLWIPATYLSNAGIANPVATPSINTIYTVVVTNNFNCSTRDSVNVTVFTLANAPFTTDTPCLHNLVHFSDTLPNVTGYLWNFGDGTVGSSLGTPTHLYDSAGTYSVTLIVQSAIGCKDTTQQPVTVYPLPDPNFIFSPACINSPVTFTDTSGGIVGYNWNFGDGSANSTLSTPSHTFTTPGTYNIGLSVQSIHGCKDTVTEPLTTLPTPVVTISNDTTICKYGVAQLQAGGGSTYAWQPVTGLSNPNISNPLASPAATTTYTVAVTNTFQCTSKDSTRVTVYSLPGTAFTSDTPCANNAVTFSDTSSGITGYNWTFGDGTVNSSQATPTHLYSLPGVYVVTLVAQSALGCLDTLQQAIVVYALPDPHFAADSACLNTPMTFTDASTNISSYLWNFGDGSALSTNSYPSHTYTAPGTYRVTLVVKSPHGCVDSSALTVSPFPLPVVTIINDTVVCPSSNVQLYAGGGVTYLWKPYTGLSDSAIADPVAFITNAITYTVYVTNQYNCTSSDSVKITLLPLTQVEAGNDVEIDKGQTIQLNGTANGNNVSWTPTNSLNNATVLNPLATPDSTTAYILTVTGPNGCLASDTVTVNILRDGYAFPNAFSPNGDGKNDLFYPVLQPDVHVVGFRIYNRWGEVVYDDPTRGWDGKLKGKDQPAGTFIYYAILRIPNSLLPSGSRDVKHEGSFTLLR